MLEIFFLFLALLAFLGGLGVILFRQPIHCAISLLLTLLSLAGIYLIFSAEFIAAAQIVIYAGGILIIFLFAIMFVSVREAEKKKKYIPGWLIFAFFGFLLFLNIGIFIRSTIFEQGKGLGDTLLNFGGNTEAISHTLYNYYLIPFEVVSLFLLVAMVGAILMGYWGVKK